MSPPNHAGDDTADSCWRWRCQVLSWGWSYRVVDHDVTKSPHGCLHAEGYFHLTHDLNVMHPENNSNMHETSQWDESLVGLDRDNNYKSRIDGRLHMRTGLLLPWLLFEVESMCKGAWVFPLFWHVRHLIGVVTDPLDVNLDGRARVGSWPPPNWSLRYSHRSSGCSRRPLECHRRLSGCHQGAADLAVLRPKRISLQDVLIMEAIDLDVWIFMPAPRWTPTIMVYDNEFIWG
jgi:hypothetical protein